MKLKLIIIGCILNFIGYAQKIDFPKEEAILIREYDSVIKNLDYYTTSDSERAIANEFYVVFKKHFIGVISDPESMQYSFPYLNKLQVQSSPDSKLRFWEWQTPADYNSPPGTSGSAIQFISADNKMHLTCSDDTPPEGVVPSQSYIKSIAQIPIKGQTIYLIFENELFTGGLVENSVSAVKIQGDSLAQDSVFLLWGKHLSAINNEYELSSQKWITEEGTLNIIYNSKTGTLSFPQSDYATFDYGDSTTDTGSISSAPNMEPIPRKIIQLKFDGTMFK